MRSRIRLQRLAAPQQLPAMPGDLKQISSIIESAVRDGQLMEGAASNIRSLLNGSSVSLYVESVNELAEAGAWDELNDRFYKTLAFGTGGLRGRTIGKIVTVAERGGAGQTHARRLDQQAERVAAVQVRAAHHDDGG